MSKFSPAEHKKYSELMKMLEQVASMSRSDSITVNRNQYKTLLKNVNMLEARTNKVISKNIETVILNGKSYRLNVDE